MGCFENREEEEAKKIPYEEEMMLCEYLVKFLRKTFLDEGVEAEQENIVKSTGTTALEVNGVQLKAFK